MRTTSNSTTVCLYHLSEEDAAAQTLFYGSMSDALTVARRQRDDVHAGLWLATDNDVVAFLDLEDR